MNESNSNDSALLKLIEKLQKDFSINRFDVPVTAGLSVIKEHLTIKIQELMSRNYERFLNNLYRIDVSESKVLEILHAKDRTSIPEKLADLIIERQLMRIKTQILYRQGKF